MRGINLTLIQSRPTGAGLGSYLFWMDFEGHVADARVGEALMGLRRVCSDVRFVGSYRRADRTARTSGAAPMTATSPKLPHGSRPSAPATPERPENA